MESSNFAHPIDEICLQALRRDCRKTQAHVYQRYAKAAWTLALRLSSCEAHAWDAVQEGFLQAFSKINQLRDPARFGFWLRRIIVNQVMDQYRHPFEPLPAEMADQPGPAASVSNWMDIENALAELTELDRMVIWLHDAEGMTHEEIADLAEQSISWSKSRLSRARKRLQQQFRTEQPEASGLEMRRANHVQ